MLMGSVMYFDSVDVMLILGTSFKYRRNEARACNTHVSKSLRLLTRPHWTIRAGRGRANSV